MINKKKTGLCLALAATLIASSALCGCQQSDSSTSAKFNSDVKDASKYTADENAQVYKTLDFSDEQEKEFAKKGFITAPDKLEIKTENGTVAWSQSAYDFIRNSSTPTVQTQAFGETRSLTRFTDFLKLLTVFIRSEATMLPM